MTSPMIPPLPATLVEPKPPDPATPYAEKVSFAAALAKPKLRPRFQPIPLPNRQYGFMEGQPRISFTSAELDAGAKAYQFSLIAKFTVGRPSIDIIRQAFQANWAIKGRATLSEIWDARHLMVILDSEEDMIAAMTCPLRKVQHAMFRLFRYSADYNPRHESTVAVKWLRLPGLPPPLFHRNYIGAIVNSFADFLDTDDRTKACATMRYARACAEIDVTHPIPSRVWIDLPEDKGYWQDIILEGNLAYCSHCKIHGHELAQCRKRKPAEQGPSQGTVTIKSRPPQGKTKQPGQEWTEVSHKKKSSVLHSHFGYGPDMLYKATTSSKGIALTADVGDQLGAEPPVTVASSDPPLLLPEPDHELPDTEKQSLLSDTTAADPKAPTKLAHPTAPPTAVRNDNALAQPELILKCDTNAADAKVNAKPTLPKAPSITMGNPSITAAKESAPLAIKGILKHTKPAQSSKSAVNTSMKDPTSAPPPTSLND